ncbi:hypothetical protein DL96DRAFT_1819198 [Flagelloscypha sp. PMI_526]|nr:hypothetical protein DL96DRAFT_1819198 [Flagelloscypha sp. PMI_526]
MSWIWEHIGNQLTTLSVVMLSKVHNFSFFFPEHANLSGLLPALQVMEVTLLFMNLGGPPKVSSQQLKVISCISKLYVRSTSLKCLRINSYNFDQSTLAELLPLHADAFPSLGSLTLQVTIAHSTSVWSHLVGEFVALHSEKLKVLRLIGPLVYQPGLNTTRWLNSISFPANFKLELHNTVGYLSQTEIPPILQPSVLIAWCLKSLTLNLVSDLFSIALPDISAAAPHLESFHIRDVDILSTTSVVLLARHFPNLYSLCLEFSSFSTTLVASKVGFYIDNTADSFINDFRGSPEDVLTNWKLFDISLFWFPCETRKYRKLWHSGLLKAFAARIPSLGSFNGEGDKFGVEISSIACPCSFRRI